MVDGATYLLVLQWPATTQADLEALVALEDVLEATLPPARDAVDGHDFGSGQMNLFIESRSPEETFSQVRTVLAREERWAGVRAAWRALDEDEYVVVWPPGLTRFEVT